MRTARDLLEMLDALGFEWRYAACNVRHSFDPFEPTDLQTVVEIEIPVGRLSPAKVDALIEQLRSTA